MQTLSELRDHLRSRTDVGHFLRLADKYLADQKTKGRDFILPFEHREVRPILDRFPDDITEWYKFALMIRNDMRKDHRNKTPDYEDVKSFCRILDIRATQIWRRNRARRAVAKAVEMGVILDSTDIKEMYIKKCVQLWMRMKQQELQIARSRTLKGRLSQEEQEEILNNFWERIDEELENGKVPQL